ncbi:ubiquitin-conjugating enzyme E2-binding protein [Podospora fimiseda]|uniref:Ubiquitin-conjugating enzyme E2-binding protein n=1 Tax=Podospora fimiseda TaxID=252190 RepID=A0AAN7BJC7_9PEZI|nr:ubiquitin-conjugating enzyme E2-binding protein [Podospora fimiseda]
MTSSCGVSLYAEFLPNIRQISVAASLPSPANDTRLVVHADGATAELSYLGDSYKLSLPSRVSAGDYSAHVNPSRKGSTSLSWRLPVHISVPHQPRSHDSNTEPVWSATDFETGCEVLCRNCHSVVVSAGTTTVWKDLPSENWAEMMEFWHCHKPGDHSHHDQADASGKADEQSLAARGYGASSIVSAQSGVGFVDLTTLMFTESDCQNLTYSPSNFESGLPNMQDITLEGGNGEGKRHLNVFCTSCRRQIGFYVFRSAGVTLHKWQIFCKSKSGASPRISECLASTIISTTARTGCSKSLIMPIDGNIGQTDGNKLEQTTIHIWVMNNNIIYTSNGTTDRSTWAIKLFYRLIPRAEADKMLEKITQEAQEINLPPQAIHEVVQHLEASNILLPLSGRDFKEWKVGLLAR